MGAKLAPTRPPGNARRRHGHDPRESPAPQSKRQSAVEFPRLRLPLPERTGSDRDELLCPYGFVDRAYSVFLRRCVATNRYFSTATYLRQPTRCDSVPLWVLLRPRGGAALPCGTAARSERGYEPPGACAPVTSHVLDRRLPRGALLEPGGGPEVRAPMEVPDLRTTLPNVRPRSPSGSPATLGSRA